VSFVVLKLTLDPQMPKEATKAKVSVVYPSLLQALAHSDLSSQTRKAAEKTEKAKAPRAGRSKKDPNAPKRPLSAYMFFSQDWRERIKAENPDAGFGMSFFFKRSLTELRVYTQAKLASSSVRSGNALRTKIKRQVCIALFDVFSMYSLTLCPLSRVILLMMKPFFSSSYMLNVSY
jgi:hypothetical protein